MKILGIEPVSYTRKSDGKPASGFRMYVQVINENVYGIATNAVWLKEEVYRDFIQHYEGDPTRALGEEVDVYYNAYKTPVKVIPVAI